MRRLLPIALALLAVMLQVVPAGAQFEHPHDLRGRQLILPDEMSARQSLRVCDGVRDGTDGRAEQLMDYVLDEDTTALEIGQEVYDYYDPPELPWADPSDGCLSNEEWNERTPAEPSSAGPWGDHENRTGDTYDFPCERLGNDEAYVSEEVYVHCTQVFNRSYLYFLDPATGEYIEEGAAVDVSADYYGTINLLVPPQEFLNYENGQLVPRTSMTFEFRNPTWGGPYLVRLTVGDPSLGGEVDDFGYIPYGREVIAANVTPFPNDVLARAGMPG